MLFTFIAKGWGLSIRCLKNSSSTNTNTAPSQPSDPNPSAGATEQPTNITLSWNCIDPDGDLLTYKIFLGTSSNPPLVAENHTSTTFNSGDLDENTQYYWKVIANDNNGHEITSPIWEFTTASATGFWCSSSRNSYCNLFW